MPLVVIAGKEYGTGSSRDWAAKGTKLLGVRAVIAESFERIHRSNLVGMGVLPLTFTRGMTRQSLKPSTAARSSTSSTPRRGFEAAQSNCRARSYRSNGQVETIQPLCRIDTLDELEYFRHGGILPFVLRQLAG